MSEHDQVIQEEFEVLESIYTDELERISNDELHIRVDPEEGASGIAITTLLKVIYPPEYPDAVPNLSLDALEGDLDHEEENELLMELRAVGQESLGMAMVFTLVSHLRESLTSLVTKRVKKREQGERDRAQAADEAEMARTHGTAVTPASFAEWRKLFEVKMKLKSAQEEEERTKGMSPKEKEEFKRMKTKPSGRQLFERDKNLAVSDASYVEEGVVSVDISQYDRSAVDEEEEDNVVHFSDSD